MGTLARSTGIIRNKGRCYHIEPVAGEESQFIAYVAYPLDLFEEGSVTNMFTSIVGNVWTQQRHCQIISHVFIWLLKLLKNVSDTR